MLDFSIRFDTSYALYARENLACQLHKNASLLETMAKMMRQEADRLWKLEKIEKKEKDGLLDPP